MRIRRVTSSRSASLAWGGGEGMERCCGCGPWARSVAPVRAGALPDPLLRGRVALPPTSPSIPKKTDGKRPWQTCATLEPRGPDRLYWRRHRMGIMTASQPPTSSSVRSWRPSLQALIASPLWGFPGGFCGCCSCTPTATAANRAMWDLLCGFPGSPSLSSTWIFKLPGSLLKRSSGFWFTRRDFSRNYANALSRALPLA